MTLTPERPRNGRKLVVQDETNTHLGLIRLRTWRRWASCITLNLYALSYGSDVFVATISWYQD